MKITLTILLFCFFVSTNCFAQQLKKGTIITDPPLTPTPKKTVQIRFIATADCQLIINGSNKGYYSANRETTLDLLPGTYILLAIDTAAGYTKKQIEKVTTRSKSRLIKILLQEHIDSIKQSVAKGIVPIEHPTNIQFVTINVDSIRIKDSIENVRLLLSKEVINKLKGDLIEMKGGAFLMGGKGDSKDLFPEHNVSINKILFSKYEITQEQWEVIMGTNPSLNKGCVTCPVENVSWHEVNAFIKKINQIGNETFRLPTEAEWEYVAQMNIREEIGRKEKTKDYLDNAAWYISNSNLKTHRIGQKTPKIVGAYDMFGNVAEWCSDWYDPNYYKLSPRSNPKGPSDGNSKVIRGGSFKDNEVEIRPFSRSSLDPNGKYENVGFRLVKDITGDIKQF